MDLGHSAGHHADEPGDVASFRWLDRWSGRAGFHCVGRLSLWLGHELYPLERPVPLLQSLVVGTVWVLMLVGRTPEIPDGVVGVERVVVIGQNLWNWFMLLFGESPARSNLVFILGFRDPDVVAGLPVGVGCFS